MGLQLHIRERSQDPSIVPSDRGKRRTRIKINVTFKKLVARHYLYTLIFCTQDEFEVPGFYDTKERKKERERTVCNTKETKSREPQGYQLSFK